MYGEGKTRGKVSELKIDATTNQACAALIFDGATECLKPYIKLYFLKNYQDIRRQSSGGVQPNLNLSIIKQTQVPLAPLNEQHRIVAAIETQFTRLDAAVTALKRSQANLKRYRAAVRKAACEGRLVPTEAELAQAEDRSYEPASVLLERVARLRSQTLEEEYPNEAEARTQLRKQKQQSIPVGLSELPTGWTWATLMQCSLVLVDCHNKTAPYTDSGVILLRTSNIRNGKLLLDDVAYITEDTFKRWAARTTPQAGDILITREAPMGEVCIIPDGIQVCMGQRMMLIRVVPDTILREFLLYSLQDPDLMRRVQDKPVGVTVQHLRVGGIETLLVPVPPLAEQQRIVAEVERRLSLIDQLEKTVAADLARANRLRQSILKRAFAGQLVPQDPDDEPAAVLLERIQAAKHGQPAQAKLPL